MCNINQLRAFSLRESYIDAAVAMTEIDAELHILFTITINGAKKAAHTVYPSDHQPLADRVYDNYVAYIQHEQQLQSVREVCNQFQNPVGAQP